MLLLALIALPVLAAGVAFALPSDRQRARTLLPAAAAAHLALTLAAIPAAEPRARSAAGSRSTRPDGSCCCS